MKGLRAAFKILVSLLFVATLGLTGLYGWIAPEVPRWKDAGELRRALAAQAAAVRQAELENAPEKPDQGRFQPDFDQPLRTAGQLSKYALLAQVAADGCPDYAIGDKEQGAAWILRVTGFAASRKPGSPGPGRCQLAYAAGIARFVGVPDGAARALAANRIDALLSRDELLATWLSLAWYAPGTYGAADAATRLFDQKIEELDPSHAAELRMAQDTFADVQNCVNPQRLTARRDLGLDQLRAFALITDAEAAAGKKQPLSCQKGEGLRKKGRR